MPSHWEISLSIVTNTYNIVTKSNVGIVNTIKFRGIISVSMNEGIAITPRALNILDPVMFPIAIPLLPFLAAITDVANSGNEVPIAMAVTAIISSPIFNNFDNSITDLIVKSAEIAISIPDPNNINGYLISILPFFASDFSSFSISDIPSLISLPVFTL